MSDNTIPQHFKVIEPSMKSALCLWWAFTWRSLILIILAYILMSIVMGVLGYVAMSSESGAVAGIFAILAGFLTLTLSFIVQIYVFKRLMFKGFGTNKRLLIVEDKDEQAV